MSVEKLVHKCGQMWYRQDPGALAFLREHAAIMLAMPSSPVLYKVSPVGVFASIMTAVVSSTGTRPDDRAAALDVVFDTLGDAVFDTVEVQELPLSVAHHDPFKVFQVSTFVAFAVRSPQTLELLLSRGLDPNFHCVGLVSPFHIKACLM